MKIATQTMQTQHLLSPLFYTHTHTHTHTNSLQRERAMGMVSFISTVPSLVSLPSTSAPMPTARYIHSVSPRFDYVIYDLNLITIHQCQGTVNCKLEGDCGDEDRFSRRRVLHCIGAATIGIVSLFALQSHNAAHFAQYFLIFVFLCLLLIH